MGKILPCSILMIVNKTTFGMTRKRNLKIYIFYKYQYGICMVAILIFIKWNIL